jgi:hypothetical protein
MPDFDDLLWPDGTDNIGGTQVNHYYAPLNDFQILPVVVTPAVSLEDTVTIEDDVVFYTGHKFFKIYSTIDTGRVADKLVGELDGKSFEHTFEWFFPGTRAKALALITKFANSNMIFIASEADGQKRLIGSTKFPAKLSMSDVDTGAKTADRKGIKMKVESRGISPAPIYTGAIPLTPAIPE